MTINRENQPLIVLVHGLWMSGFELGVLKHRLEESGDFRACAFSYPSLTGSMDNHVRSLIDFARAQNSQSLHFIGHSLGGLVILGALLEVQDLPPGRAVLLGTPLQGSRAAQGVARLPFGKMILGSAVHDECVEFAPREWTGQCEVGIIAGSMGLGLGRLVAKLDVDNDGTVLVEETKLPGAKDHIVLPVTHTGMVFSSEVAEQAMWFLKNGMFKKSDE